MTELPLHPLTLRYPIELYTYSLTLYMPHVNRPLVNMATEAITRFFQSPYFAVAGASQDPSKYGYKGPSITPDACYC